MFHLCARTGTHPFSKRSAARRGRPSRQQPRNFLPRLEALEGRALPSTVAYQVPAGTVGQQDFSGPLGMDFNVAQSIVVTELGVFDSGSDGLAVPLTARLYNRDNQTQVASLPFAAGQTGTLVGGSRFLPLASPVVLPAGFHGTIVAEGYGSGEEDGNAMVQPVTWSTDNDSAIQFVGTGRYGLTPGSFPAILDAGPANRYAAGTLTYLPAQQIATGPASASAGQAYTLQLALTEATNITGWTIQWGDGSVQTIAGNPSQVTHVYSSGGTFAIGATAQDSTLGALGTSYSAVVLADAPAAYWQLGETGNTTVAHDLAGGNNAAFYNFSAADLGQPGPLTSDTGTSVHFNGTNQYVGLPDVFNYPTFGLTTGYAVSFGAWFKTTTGGVILGQSDAAAVPGGAAPTGWTPGVYVGTDGKVYSSLFWHNAVTPLTSAGAYNDGQWHQVMDVYDRGYETLYLDGNAVASMPAWTYSYAGAYAYTLGVGYTALWPNTPGGWSFFNGQLAQASAYGAALSAQQVAAQFVAGTTARPDVTVQNATPVASLQGPTTGVRGQALNFTFAATSPAAAEQAAGFTYTVNWGDGTPVQTLPRTSGNGAGVLASHVFPGSGTFTVTVVATDEDGHATLPVSTSVSVAPWAIQTQPDPLHAGKTVQVLVVGGTMGSDIIEIARGPHGGGIQVDINEKTLHQQLSQVFSSHIDWIVVYGQDGNDLIQVAYNLQQTAELFAGKGNNVLIGGGGDNLLVGGPGNDVLVGGVGRNVLIGGGGNNVLIGWGGQDLLIAGSTAYDTNRAALESILAEWEAPTPYAMRVAHLLGTQPGGRNGNFVLNASTVHDDGLGDYVWGGSGGDWFMMGKESALVHRRPNEIVTLLGHS